ncbi:MAG: hypothetical protein JWL59_3278 [Chthoniobacteraceae bacterium]|nr:hypothetical protein [Chthoniobacteraceae bacterium]
MKISIMAALCATSLAAFAQDAPRKDGPPPEGPGRRPAPPIMAALDTNKDGELDAAEIANASAALKALDTNGDGKISNDELRPPRGPGGDRPPGGERGPGGERRGPGAPPGEKK